MPVHPFVSLLVAAALAAVPAGDPYFLLRPRLQAADVVVVARVGAVREVKRVLRSEQVVAEILPAAIWKGGVDGYVPESIEILDWDGPEADPDRKHPWLLFLGRTGKRWNLQAFVDLASLTPGRRDMLDLRVAQYQEVEAIRHPALRSRAIVEWLMGQVRDPVSREGATYDLQRDAFHVSLREEQIAELQDLYCSLTSFDSTAGHLTDILEEVAIDRERFVRCALDLLRGEVDRATWLEQDLVRVLDAGLACDEVHGLAEAYRETRPVARLRGYVDDPAQRETRREVLRELCELATRRLEEGAVAGGGGAEAPRVDADGSDVDEPAREESGQSGN